MFSILLAVSALVSTAHAGPTEAANDISKRITQFVGEDLSKTSITDLDHALGLTGKTKDQPWSGSYWALYNGSVAWPYMIEGTDYRRFRYNYENFLERLPTIRAAAIKGTLSAQDLANLSATEKYDLYLGDYDFTLTRAVWQSIQDHAVEQRSIEEWEGFCHGWATASAYVKRPQHKIVVPSLANSTVLVPFYPDDLKALATLLWANSLIQDFTISEGYRCHTNSPEFDESNGKVTEWNCKGVNPAVWHLSVLGLVGKQKKPFILNKNNDKEVWNQPVSHYEIRYFNPNRGRYGDLEDSIVRMSRWRDDFSRFRADATAYLVGVEMKLYYISETDPAHNDVDGKEKDLIEHLLLRYDLELDENYRIVGGEWQYGRYSGFDSDDFKLPKYPSFMWRFKSDTPIAMSVADSAIPFAGIQTLDAKTRIELSKKAAGFRYQHFTMDENRKPVVEKAELRPQPLGAVVYPLIEWAHR